MRLIDADKLFNWNEYGLAGAVKYGNKDSEQQKWSYSTVMMYEVRMEIEDAPTIDLESLRPHGRWLVLGQRTYGGGRSYTHYCSECGQHGFDDYKLCHGCGAIMDKEEQ